jgi:hypothetical protein
MLHEGGNARLRINLYFNELRSICRGIARLQFILFGFTGKLLNQLAPKIRILRATSGLVTCRCLIFRQIRNNARPFSYVRPRRLFI